MFNQNINEVLEYDEYKNDTYVHHVLENESETTKYNKSITSCELSSNNTEIWNNDMTKNKYDDLFNPIFYEKLIYGIDDLFNPIIYEKLNVPDNINDRTFTLNEFYTRQYSTSNRIKGEMTCSRYFVRDCSIASITGIIVSKNNNINFETFDYEINDIEVCKINIELLMKLFGHDIENNLYYIPIPNKFYIKKSIDKNFSFGLLDIDEMYGTPLFCLNYHVVRYLVKANVNYTLNYKFTNVKELNIFPELYIDKKETKETLLTMIYTSSEKIKFDITLFKQMLENNKNEIINKCDTDIDTMIISLNIIKSMIFKNKNHLLCNISLHEMVYKEFREMILKEINEITVHITKDICKLIVDYNESNFDLIIYEIMDEDHINFYKIYNKTVEFNGGKVLSVI